MADHNKDAMADELENRLDDLFSEPEEVYGEELPDQESAGVDSPLTGLKSIILSIDWEISDNILDELDDELERLKPEYETQKEILVFLQMLGSIGKYIKAHKAESHPNALRLMNEVFENLEAVVLAGDDVSAGEKKRRLTSVVGKFKELKAEIKRMKAGTAAAAVPAASPEPGVEVSGQALSSMSAAELSQLSTNEVLVMALEEMKQGLAAEFSALRAELRKWRSGE